MDKRNVAFILLSALVIGTLIGFGVYYLLVNNYPDAFVNKNSPVIDTTTNKLSSVPEKQVITIKNVNNPKQLKEILDVLQQYSKDKKITELKIEYKKDTIPDTISAKK